MAGMKAIRNITEDEMIAVFLRGEFASERFGGAIHEQLAHLEQPDTVATHPDITDAAQNKIRRDILSAARGYGQRTEVFGGFPRDVEWLEVELTKAELARVKYIDYSYWTELMGGSRLPKDAAAAIEAGTEIFGVSNDGFKRAARAVREGKQFPTMILAGETTDNLVALEGHLRLTAYALAWDNVPETMKVIVGVSPHMGEWGLY